MKYALAALAIFASLHAPAEAQALAEIERLTGQEWVSTGLTVYTSGADSAFVVSDSLYWVKSESSADWVRCETEPEAFPLDSLQSAARAVLRGRAAVGVNGPLARMEACVTTIPAVLDSFR